MVSILQYLTVQQHEVLKRKAVCLFILSGMDIPNNR